MSHRCFKKPGVPRRFRDAAGLAVLLLIVSSFLCASVVDALAGKRLALALVNGDDVPPLRGDTPDGGRLVLDYKAHPVTIVNFWATWCEPCKDEMPALERLHQELGEQIGVFGVMIDGVSPLECGEFLESMGVSYPVIIPQQQKMSPRWGGISALPTTFLINGEGKVLRRYVGATPEQIEGLDRDIRAAVAGKPLPTQVMPLEDNSVTDEDRVRQKRLGS